jgi:exopolysaccharide biosynthesis polyprenyl glycosylphosphotransferase
MSDYPVIEDGRKLKTAGSMTGGRATVDEDLRSPEPVRIDQEVAPSTLKQRLMGADALVVALGIALAFAWQSLMRSGQDLGVQRTHLVLAFATFPVWIVAFSMNKLYQARAVERPTEEVRRIFTASAISVGIILAVAFAGQFKALSRLWIVSVLVFVPILMIVERTVARRMFTRMRRAGRICRPILIVGTDADAVGLLHAAQRSPHVGYRVVGFVGPDDIGTRGGCTVLGDIDDTRDVLEATGATGVLISLSSVATEVVNRLTRELTDAGYHVALSSGLHDIDVMRFRAQDLGGRTLIYVEQTRRDGWRAMAKRAFDITLALVALVFSAPLTIVAAVAIKRSSPGPVIFAQERVGLDGRPFRIYKFRTMVADADARKAELASRNEADGPMFKIADDPRVTRVGALLRKLSIDEIPQFVNVLRGEMSVVGPRPALATEVEQWTDDVHERLRVLPGITGMWQVSGRSDTTFDEYKRLDLYYVDNWSLAHDMRIVLKTFSAVTASRGAR